MKGQLILKSNFFLFLLCCCLSCGTAQPVVDSTASAYMIKGDFLNFATDKLQQIYTIDRKNEVVKYNQQGQLTFRFNNNRLGTLGHIDVTDPFNVLLYYPDYQTVITLNRTLNVSGQFDFGTLGYFQVTAVGMSSDLNIWLYDETTFQLKKMDRNGELLLRSEDLNLRLGISPQPNFVLERENQVFLNDPEQGILVFDLYGKYQKTIDIKGLRSFQLMDGQLIYQEANELLVYNLRTLRKTRAKLPTECQVEEQLYLQRSKLYIRNEEGIRSYDL